MTERIVWGVVVYKAAIEYLDDFFESLLSQTLKKFSVLVINDDVEDKELKSLLKKYNDLSIDIINNIDNKNPCELRILLIKEAKLRGHDLLILGDCDDKFSNDRAELIYCKYLEQPDYGFYYNNLKTFSGNKIFNEMPISISSIEMILEQNFLGLSNVAINLAKYDDLFLNTLYENGLEIFDWYFFSRSLLNRIYGIYVDTAITYYRIHSNNIAGINEISESTIEKEIMIKRKHYDIMKKYADIYNKLILLYSSSIYRDNIYQNTFWWGNIRLLEKGYENDKF